MSVASSDDGLAASGLDDEEMRQNYLEDVLDAAPSQSPPKKVKASSSFWAAKHRHESGC